MPIRNRIIAGIVGAVVAVIVHDLVNRAIDLDAETKQILEDVRRLDAAAYEM